MGNVRFGGGGDKASIASNRANNFWFSVHHPNHPRYDPTKMKGMGLFSKQKYRESFSTMNPETDVIINIQTTCTRDEAVAKLLGWSRGRYFPRSVQVTKHGIDVVDLGLVSHFEGSVQEQLAVIYEKARSEFIDAAETGESHETLKALEEKLMSAELWLTRPPTIFLILTMSCLHQKYCVLIGCNPKEMVR